MRHSITSIGKQEQASALKGFWYGQERPDTPPPGIDIENRIIDKYLPRIGVYGFAVYLVIQRHLSQETNHGYSSYATIARKLGMDQGAVIRHVKKLKRLHLLSPSLRFKEDEGGA